jgi:hypothetical protein
MPITSHADLYRNPYYPPTALFPNLEKESLSHLTAALGGAEDGRTKTCGKVQSRPGDGGNLGE